MTLSKFEMQGIADPSRRELQKRIGTPILAASKSQHSFLRLHALRILKDLHRHSSIRLPELLHAQDIPPSTTASAECYVTLELQPRDASAWFDYPQVRQRTWTWSEEDASPLFRRLGEEEITTLFRGRRPTLKMPTVDLLQGNPESPRYLLPLIMRRNLPERSL